MFDPRNIIWNFPGFATILLILNQLRIKCMSLDNFRVASPKFGEHKYIVVSSAKLETSVSWMKKIKWFIKRLNNIGPMIEPCVNSSAFFLNHFCWIPFNIESPNILRYIFFVLFVFGFTFLDSVLFGELFALFLSAGSLIFLVLSKLFFSSSLLSATSD